MSQVEDIEYEDISGQRFDYRNLWDYVLNYLILLIPVLGTLIMIARVIYFRNIHEPRKFRNAWMSLASFYLIGFIALLIHLALR